jgi:RimJ/RimL family protein N-acetyltransferase
LDGVVLESLEHGKENGAMMIELRALELGDMVPILEWRNGAMETLRTPMRLNREQQEQWYRDVICDRRSTTRYWALVTEAPDKRLVGYGGIENIQWENRNGEISLLIAPEHRGKQMGARAVRLFLEQAFDFLNLENVYGECYTCGHVEFWRKAVQFYYGESCLLPSRKYYAGVYYASYYFTFNRETYRYYFGKRGQQEDTGQEYTPVSWEAYSGIQYRGCLGGQAI